MQVLLLSNSDERAAVPKYRTRITVFVPKFRIETAVCVPKFRTLLIIVGIKKRAPHIDVALSE